MRIHIGASRLRTALGKLALLDDGTRLLETDLNFEAQVNCKACLRSARKKENASA